MQTYRVIQWATGVVGSAALKGIIRHPQLELAAVKVYSEAKEGMDAGQLAGTDDTGIIATRDVDAVIATGADCVLYCPMPWDVDAMCQLLRAGIHVIDRRDRRGAGGGSNPCAWRLQ